MGGEVERAQRILDQAHRVTYHSSEGVINYYQDVEGHLEYAKKMRRRDREERGAFGKRRAFHQVMSPPINVLMMVCQKLGIPFGKVFEPEQSRRIWAELKKPEYAGFRTSEDKRL